MKKYVFVETGEAVELGNKLVKVVNTLLGSVVIEEVEITEKTLPVFIKEGVISVQEEERDSVDHNFYLEHLAKRIHWDVDNLRKYLGNLYTIYPNAVFSILLREVAIVLDEKYDNHIENSKEIYSISSLNGEITKVKDLNKIKNFKNFAAFRSLEDAITAKKILEEPMKQLFKRNGK